MNKDELILQSMEDEYDFDELVESNIENLKLENEDNLMLLSNLLKEVTSQIESNSPNLLKIKNLILK